MKRVVQTSGGTGSWATARRIVDEHGTEGLVLLFADTLVEDEDLYRFLADVAADIGVPITRVCDGRTPEQVDVDRRWLSNSKVAQCSLELKIKPCREWLEANCDPADTMLYVGIDWSEIERIPGIVDGWAPWRVDMPLTRPPYVDKHQVADELRQRGIEPPRLTARLGFPHNNCGGACVRGGQAQWLKLYRTFPERFAAKEAHEQRMRAELGADVAILKTRVGGTTRPLPLTLFRQRIEYEDRNGPAALIDRDDWGGCGCLTDFTATGVA